MLVIKFKAFRKKWIWSRRVQKGICANFSTFDDWKVNRNFNEICNLGVEICQQLAALKNNFDDYFEGAISISTALWVTHPFKAKLESIADNDSRKDKLIDLQWSTTLPSKFISYNGGFLKF